MLRHFIATPEFTVEGDGIVIEDGVATVFNRYSQGELVPVFRFPLRFEGSAGWFGLCAAGQAHRNPQPAVQGPAPGLARVMPGPAPQAQPDPVQDPAYMQPGGQPLPHLDPGRPDPDREIGALQRQISRDAGGGLGYG